jgi:hypothetical protein
MLTLSAEPHALSFVIFGKEAISNGFPPGGPSMGFLMNSSISHVRTGAKKLTLDQEAGGLIVTSTARRRTPGSFEVLC